MKKRCFAVLLAGLMLCSLMGCGDDIPNPKTEDDETPTTTTTTTTTAPQADAPLILMAAENALGSLFYEDTDAVTANETLVLKATANLTDVCFLALNPDPPTIGDRLHHLPSLAKGKQWAIKTYVNDAAPNRGVCCTDEAGNTRYFAFTYSGKDGSVSLTELNIAPLSQERLEDIQTALNDNAYNGFVSMNEYSCPEEADLLDILYGGAGIGVDSWEWSNEEQQDYLVASGWEEFYISATRFARADVEALIQKRLGISLDELDNDLLYIEKYDAYYHAHSDTQWQPIQVTDGWLEGGEGGVFIVNYVIGPGDSWSGNHGRVTMKLNKDGYQFISNTELEE